VSTALETRRFTVKAGEWIPAELFLEIYEEVRWQAYQRDKQLRLAREPKRG
jgi:hypothetical protein